MARLLSLILALFLSLPAGAEIEAALGEYRALEQKIGEAERNLRSAWDPTALLLSLTIERDGLDAHYPFRPGEPGALGEARRRVDGALSRLRRAVQAQKNAPAPTKKR